MRGGSAARLSDPIRPEVRIGLLARSLESFAKPRSDVEKVVTTFKADGPQYRFVDA